ncbi:hypothetical protein SUGI_1144440 [Cryptomeria japonica]|nr:hypothetical protein SUGI_1144440 [Cryptomeria japonica]
MEQQKRSISLSLEEDEIVWCVASSVTYNVKMGYEILRRKLGSNQWPAILCWHKFIAHQAGGFLWVSLHGRILIGDGLKTIGIVIPSILPMCRKNEESMNHVILWCPFVATCWE